jgi:L-ribulose-5-phosphate 4-epimerase
VTRLLRRREIGGDYEAETGRVICEAFRALDPAEAPGVLVNRHAPFTWGPTVAKALECAVAVELCARLAFLTLQLNPSVGAIQPDLLDRHFLRKHGPRATYGQR